MVSNTRQHLQKLITITILINIMEGIFFFLHLLSIPTDPKNAFIGNYSLNRFFLLITITAILFCNIFLLLKRNTFTELINRFSRIQEFSQILTILGYTSGFLLWFTLFYPDNRFGDAAAAVVRIKPLILWLELIGIQAYLCFLFFMNRWEYSGFKFMPFLSRKNLLRLIIIILAGIGLVVYLNYQHFDEAANPYSFPPSAPISPLQLFGCIVLLVFILLLQHRYRDSEISYTKWLWFIFLIIWLSTAIIWNQTNLPCTDDRPGPYPPNYECYPQTDDAVYSIGSHYTSLGEGIYNHWLTDKPLYMLFLAVGQLIFGQRISQYIFFQIILLALIPALLFLYAAKFTRFPTGIFLSILTIIIGLNEISHYIFIGGVNAKLENSELLTALFLILFCFLVTSWWKSPRKIYLAAAAGGLLGLASLLRMNPLFIAPFIVIIAFFSQRKRKAIAEKNILLFSLCFLLTFLPTILTSQDSQGNNYYWQKIEDVIDSRYLNTSSPIGRYIEPTSAMHIKVAKPISEYGNTKNYDFQESQSNGSAIMLHFWNNVLSSAAILPANFSFVSISTEPEQFPIWDFSTSKPIWQREISTQNKILLTINLLIISLGIIHHTRNNGISGLAPFIIQTGYHIGNAFAKTSGGRFLQAVNWVTLFYYSIGIVVIVSFLVKVLTPSVNTTANTQSISVENPVLNKPAINNPLRWILILCFLSGMLVPMVNLLPSSMPEEQEDIASALLLMNRSPENQISPEKWESFLSDPDHLIIRGIAYHPRYYHSSNYGNNNPTFEMMVLGKDHVIVNYLPNVEPTNPFSDGSEVVLIGCLIGQDNIWASDRLFIESIAVFQLNQEEGIFINEFSDWNCSHNSLQ
jgi:hypothetical protein